MTETYQNSVTLVNIFLLFFNGLLNFCVYILVDWLENQSFANAFLMVLFLIFKRPINDPVFAIAVKSHFGDHPAFNRHARSHHCLRSARHKWMPVR